MDVLYVLAALAIVVLVIGQQLRGQRVRASRVIGLPVALTVIGVLTLRHKGFHPGTVDWAFLAGDVVLALAIGLSRGPSSGWSPGRAACGCPCPGPGCGCGPAWSSPGSR